MDSLAAAPTWALASSGSPPHAHGGKRLLFYSQRLAPDDEKDTVMFFGGKDYVSLFYELTKSMRNKKIIFYNSKQIPHLDGYIFKRFETSTKTNWHYECVSAFLQDAIEAPKG